ncbi:MAG: Crp/Fnr family transcriptional regulator [Candidatus Eisenbacteria bacterium]
MPPKTYRKVRSCAACGRKGSGRFCELAEERKSLFRSPRTIVRYAPGQAIFQQGQPPFAIYCLVSGAAKVYKSAEGGRRVLIRVLGPGEMLGYRAVLADEPYAATAEAIKPTTACVITRENLFELLRCSPDLGRRLLAKVARELRISEEQLLTFATDPARRRLARLLLLLLKSADVPLRTGSLVPRDYLRTEMAQMIGTAPETLSRALRLLARQGILRVTRAEIRVADPGRLKAAAGPAL